MESSISRPLEGTLLAWLTTLYAVLLGLGCIFFAFMVFGGNTSISIEALNNTQFAFMNGNLQRPSLLPILVALIITIAVASGLFNGKKWAVVVSIILAILSLISGVMTLNYISIIIAALSLYAGYVCWNHAFYNRAN